MKKISVIIPIYNVERYLRQCVDSVLCQSYRNIEVILVDDGSPDGCPLICDEYKLRDERVIVIHKQNGGLSDARNAGVQLATGDFVLFIDSDDCWTDIRALQKLIDRQQKKMSEVLCFSYYKEDEYTKKKTIKAYVPESMDLSLNQKDMQIAFLMSNGLYIASACNKMISIEVVRRIQFHVGKTSEDISWCATLLKEAQSFDYTNQCFYCYRQRGGSIANSISLTSCCNLKDAIIECCKIGNTTEGILREYIIQYTAYQFSTFFAVQAFSPQFPKESINTLNDYKWVLKHHQGSQKVKVMYYGVKLFGMMRWCRLIRMTRSIWNSGRDML